MATVITNVTELQAMKNNLAGDYELGNDIDASETSGWNGGAGFEPVGTSGDPFTGTLDMVRHTISGLFINRSSEYVGLFGVTDGATTKDGTLANVNITESYHSDGRAGALAGKTIDTTISGVSSSGSVTGDGERIGGLVGYLKQGIISDCHSSCTVLATATAASLGMAFVGGLIGVAEGTTPVRCYATGSVTMYGEGAAGGLIGVMDVVDATDTPTTLSKSHATGNVIGYDYNGYVGGTLGGLVGWMGQWTKSGCTVSNAYARGNVSVQSPASAETGGLIGHIASADDLVEYSYSTGDVPDTGTVGGLIGYRRAGSTLTACFWDTETSGTSDGVGNGAETGATGKTTSQMKMKSTFVDAGWDFIVIWAIGIPNDGYPFFWAMPPEGEEALPDSPRETVTVQDKISLEMIRNVEMAARGRAFIDEEGNFVYRSRYARNP